MIKQNVLFEDNVTKTKNQHIPEDGPPCLDNTSDSKKTAEVDPKEIENHSQKFESLVDKSSRVLFKTTAVFPLAFFPDSIIVDENKVNIIHRIFFFSSEVQSILIHHIKDVIADTSLLFGTLKILPDGYNENWVYIHYLWKQDAIRARRIISGLLVGFKEGVDMTKVETPNLEQKIEALGTVN